MTTMKQRLLKYLRVRDMGMPTTTTGDKVVDEAKELKEALAGNSFVKIQHEIADVVLSAAVVAWNNNTTVEECIEVKTAADKGRGIGPTCPEHRPVQHRDGKEPWCGLCGLNSNMKRPHSNMPTREAARVNGR